MSSKLFGASTCSMRYLERSAKSGMGVVVKRGCSRVQFADQDIEGLIAIYLRHLLGGCESHAALRIGGMWDGSEMRAGKQEIALISSADNVKFTLALAPARLLGKR